MTVPYRLLGRNVLVEPQRLAERTEAGVYLPQTAVEKRCNEATVVAIGPEVVEVVVDDEVMIRRWTATEITLGERQLLVIDPSDILLVAIPEVEGEVEGE